ncbi:hypothetical protein SAMN04488038_102288 [Solimonas aquatica]|uniref:Uncharacterized protein n=1 Tax=Solimonas aquatica TaxID=489703 RepID=A0A1H9C0M8_9GAMM|nr:hypothetical protein [Solimonas aquatica]SEP94198.1 hypothetical protein SAMN04488038_102288 [Solimonas aquatica]
MITMLLAITAVTAIAALPVLTVLRQYRSAPPLTLATPAYRGRDLDGFVKARKRYQWRPQREPHWQNRVA